MADFTRDGCYWFYINSYGLTMSEIPVNMFKFWSSFLKPVGCVQTRLPPTMWLACLKTWEWNQDHRHGLWDPFIKWFQRSQLKTLLSCQSLTPPCSPAMGSKTLATHHHSGWPSVHCFCLHGPARGGLFAILIQHKNRPSKTDTFAAPVIKKWQTIGLHL